MINLKRIKTSDLEQELMELQLFRAGQHTALVEFKEGDYYMPTPETLKWARVNEGQDVHFFIDAIMCELERRNPGTFINTNK